MTADDDLSFSILININTNDLNRNFQFKADQPEDRNP